MKTLFKTLAILLVLACPTLEFDCGAEFAKFVETFSKTYDSDAEKNAREIIFCENLQSYEDWNNDASHSYKKGVHSRSDWTAEEMNSLKDLKSVPNVERKVSSNKINKRVGNPTSLDWRDQNIVTQIKDQGSCGSCWTFAGAAYAESQLIKNDGYDLDLDFSEQYLLECTSESDCNGGYMENVMQQITVQGLPLEQTYPYSPYNTYSGICSAYGTHVAYDNSNYYDITDDEMIQLLQKGPVAIALSADDWDSYSSGTFACASSATINHAVLLVGYTPDTWIVKNQWGTSWGDNGYITISRTSTQNCQIGSTAHTLSGYTLRFALYALVFMMLSIMI